MSKILKFLVANICGYLSDLRVGNVFLNKEKTVTIKKIQFNYIKI